MIIAERKPMEEIKQAMALYKKVLVAGCGTCVTVCWAGGEKEVGILASQLRLARSAEGSEIVTLEAIVERQCEKEMVAELKDKVTEVEADKIKQTIHRILSKHTGQPIEKIRADTERDFFMSSEDALEYGIIDKVITEREIQRESKK